MPIGTGQVSLNDIETEFGGSPPTALSEYYDKGNAPGSGEIQIHADFQGTSAIIPDAHTLISTHTPSGSPAMINITSGINDTYDIYQFVFSNLHPSGDNVDLMFQVNDSEHEGGTWNHSPITSTFASAAHKEDASATNTPYYETSMDQHQGTAYSRIAIYAGNYADESVSGVLTLYDPSSTTYMKHWMSRINLNTRDNYQRDAYVGGYINTGDPSDQPAITQVSFKFNSGNIDSGVIKMYGLAKS